LTRSPSSPEGARASAWRPCGGSRRRARKVVIADLDDEPGQRWPTSSAASTSARRRDKTAVDACSRASKDTYGSIDIAFNNAGISPPDDDSILDTDLDAWRRVQEVNLTSVYLCCKAVCPTCSSRARARSSTPRPSWRSWARRPRRSPTPRPRAGCCR
jgi:NAD(P)-dependent dehydrogenase (short-subunit alcohol dehydrogenase family)